MKRFFEILSPVAGVLMWPAIASQQAVAATTQTPHPTPPACRDVMGKPIPCGKLADLTAGPEIVVGGSVGGGALPSGAVGHHVNWNTSVVLTDKDAFLVSHGRCAFNLSYELRNIGGGNAGPPETPAFSDLIRAGTPPGAVSTQSALMQMAGTNRTINTQAYLPGGGPHVLSLTINDGHAAPESNFLNNYFAIKYTLDSAKCMGR